MDYLEILYLYVIAWGLFSLICFGFYYIDKKRAIKNKFRIKESTLLSTTFLMGSLGALVGLYVLRHKTKHWYFVATAWISFLIQLGILIYLITLI